MLSTVDQQKTLRLPDTTERLAVPGREDKYVLTLDVFHQMHCLDVMRMALYRDRYDKHFYRPDGTVDYCKWLHVGESPFLPGAVGSLTPCRARSLPRPSPLGPSLQRRRQRRALRVERRRRGGAAARR